MRTPTIAIIGGGFCGVMLAAHLLDPSLASGEQPTSAAHLHSGTGAAARTAPHHRPAAGTALRVVLIERRDRLGGLAFACAGDGHLLNVPAGRMSALAADPGHFLRWLQAGNPAAGGGTFPTRAEYRSYLEETLRSAQNAGHPYRRLEHVRAEVTAVVPLTPAQTAAPGAQEPPQGGYRIELDNGGRVDADACVLALGNLGGHASASRPSLAPWAAAPGVANWDVTPGDYRYIADPWAPGALDLISHIGDADPHGAPENAADAISPSEFFASPAAGDAVAAVLLGTGLTMLDVAISLGPRAGSLPMLALSRRGLVPQPHRGSPTAPALLSPPDWEKWPKTARGYLRGVRDEIYRQEIAGYEWRDVITALRPVTPAMWQALPTRQRAIFLEHLRAHWDVHRHRAAPGTWSAFTRLLADRALHIRAGRVLSVRSRDDALHLTIRPRGSEKTLTIRAAAVVNCTGPATNIHKIDDPLARDLLIRGLIRPDALGLGIDTTAAGETLAADGQPQHGLLAAGPLRRGSLWENTAVPELRVEVEMLARRLREAAGRNTAASARI